MPLTGVARRTLGGCKGGQHQHSEGGAAPQRSIRTPHFHTAPALRITAGVAAASWMGACCYIQVAAITLEDTAHTCLFLQLPSPRHLDLWPPDLVAERQSHLLALPMRSSLDTSSLLLLTAVPVDPDSKRRQTGALSGSVSASKHLVDANN